jgi:hypothetical protein
MRECPLSRHLGMEAPAPRPPRRWPGLFISARYDRSSIVEGFVGVQSLPSHLPLPYTGEFARSGWHPWPELDCIRKMASILLDAECAVNRENAS